MQGREVGRSGERRCQASVCTCAAESRGLKTNTPSCLGVRLPDQGGELGTGMDFTNEFQRLHWMEKGRLVPEVPARCGACC